MSVRRSGQPELSNTQRIKKTMNKLKKIRQGDVAYIQIEKLPEGLKAENTNIILEAGSGGNGHTFKGGKWYPKVNGQIVGYLEADNTILLHKEHGKDVKKELREITLEDGFYKVVRQVEITNKGIRPVID